MGRHCADCQSWCDPDDFSGNQWRKGPGLSRCYDCVQGDFRECSECGKNKTSSNYSNNQWSRGAGSSRCMSCVNRVYECEHCGREFRGYNQLKMHMQVHRQRNISCPICGDTRFASGANAVQHVESGYCRSCGGADYARQKIYEFASSKREMQPFLNGIPRLTYGGQLVDDVPDFPYCCRPCNRGFRQLSQLLQHNDQKHGFNLALTQY